MRNPSKNSLIKLLDVLALTITEHVRVLQPLHRILQPNAV